MYFKDDKVLIKKFIERWENKSKEIKKINLNGDQAYRTVTDFFDEFKILFPAILRVGGKDNEYRFLMEQLSNDLHFSLRIAYNNHEKENKSLWKIFFEKNLKLPPINFNL